MRLPPLLLRLRRLLPRLRLLLPRPLLLPPAISTTPPPSAATPAAAAATRSTDATAALPTPELRTATGSQQPPRRQHASSPARQPALKALAGKGEPAAETSPLPPSLAPACPLWHLGTPLERNWHHFPLLVQQDMSTDQNKDESLQAAATRVPRTRATADGSGGGIGQGREVPKSPAPPSRKTSKPSRHERTASRNGPRTPSSSSWTSWCERSLWPPAHRASWRWRCSGISCCRAAARSCWTRAVLRWVEVCLAAATAATFSDSGAPTTAALARSPWSARLPSPVRRRSRAARTPPTRLHSGGPASA